MKQQLYKVPFTPWLVTVGKPVGKRKDKQFNTKYHYCKSREEVRAIKKKAKGYIQVFRLQCNYDHGLVK